MCAAIRHRMRCFLREEDGPTTTEYAVMFAMILLVCIGTVKTLGTKVDASFALANQGW